MKAKYYLLSNDDVIQICASLQFNIKMLEDTKEILRKIKKLRVLSDEEVRQYNELTEEIEKLTEVYNKFGIKL
jgi:uncharacterized protein HemY